MGFSAIAIVAAPITLEVLLPEIMAAPVMTNLTAALRFIQNLAVEPMAIFGGIQGARWAQERKLSPCLKAIHRILQSSLDSPELYADIVFGYEQTIINFNKAKYEYIANIVNLAKKKFGSVENAIEHYRRKEHEIDIELAKFH